MDGVDESGLPILIVTYAEGGTIADLEALWEVYRRVAAENQRVAYLVDMRRFNPVAGPADQRRRAADLYRRHVDELAVSAVCEARVVSSQLVRGILVAFDWLKGEARWPCRTFVSMAEARVWIDEVLKSPPE